MRILRSQFVPSRKSWTLWLADRICSFSIFSSNRLSCSSFPENNSQHSWDQVQGSNRPTPSFPSDGNASPFGGMTFLVILFFTIPMEKRLLAFHCYLDVLCFPIKWNGVPIRWTGVPCYSPFRFDWVPPPGDGPRAFCSHEPWTMNH